MPIVEVWHASRAEKLTEDLVRDLTTNIKLAFVLVPELKLKAGQVSVHYVRSQVDVTSLERPEMTIKVWGLYRKPERTPQVINQLARKIEEAAEDTLPCCDMTLRPVVRTWLVYVFIQTWGPCPIFALATNEEPEPEGKDAGKTGGAAAFPEPARDGARTDGEAS